MRRPVGQMDEYTFIRRMFVWQGAPHYGWEAELTAALRMRIGDGDASGATPKAPMVAACDAWVRRPHRPLGALWGAI